RDGDYLAVGGFGCDRIPTAVVHEVVRQGKQNLGLAGHTATHDFQILCAGNLLGRGQNLARGGGAYVGGLGGRGPSPPCPPRLASRAPTPPGPGAAGGRPGACPPCRPAPCGARTRPGTAPPARSPARSPAPAWRRSRRCPRTWPPSTSTRPTATATAGCAAPPS